MRCRFSAFLRFCERCALGRGQARSYLVPCLLHHGIPPWRGAKAAGGYALDAHWQLSARAQNLTNERYMYCANSCRYGDERSLVGAVSYNW